MSNIRYELHEKINNIDSIYEYPNDINFHYLLNQDFDWPSPKDRNFFNMLRIMTIRGKVSLSALANAFADAEHPYDSAYQTVYRLLHGIKNNNISLQQRELVNKNGRGYELSHLGILYVIHVFHMGKYYDEVHTKDLIMSDFSYQKDLNGIFDILKKHTTHFSIFFDNLDYIKASKDIDINLFFDAVDLSYISNNLISNYNPFFTSDFDSQLEKMIPFIFYYSAAVSISNGRGGIKFKDSISVEMSKILKDVMKKMEKDYNLCVKRNSKIF